MLTERLNSPRTKEVSGGDPSEIPPVFAKRREAHCPMKQQLVGRFLDRAVGEGRAVEDLFGGLGLASDDKASEADGEGHQAGSFEGVGEAGEGLVGGGGGEGEEDAGGAGDWPAVGPGEGPRDAARGEEEEGGKEEGDEEERGERDGGDEEGEVEVVGRHFGGWRKMGKRQKTILARFSAVFRREEGCLRCRRAEEGEETKARDEGR